MFQWSTKKDQSFSTVCYLRKVRKCQIKEMRRISDIDTIAKNLKLSIKRSFKKTNRSKKIQVKY